MAELQPGERLKDRLRAGSFFSLLPVVDFLRRLTRAGWERPPQRASFVLDDANLHAGSYGFLRYGALAGHAADHGYHVNIAMIPLDGWLFRGDSLAVIRRSPHLSLIVHGNDHTRNELGRPTSDEEALPVVATAMQRIQRFEQRSGLTVDRVMSPPHALISAPAMTALRRVGFEAVCYWGPTGTSPQRDVEDVLPADLHLGGGLPGFHRVDVNAPADELVLRSYLDQPLLLSGHHTDLADGLNVLAAAVERVNRLGPVQWMSVREVARASRFVRRGDGVLAVRAFSRRLRLPAPGAASLVVEWPGVAGDRDVVVRVDGSDRVVARGQVGQEVEVPPGLDLEVSIVAPDEIDPSGVSRLPPRPWPVVRRCITEGRDRLQPLIRQMREGQARRRETTGRGRS